RTCGGRRVVVAPSGSLGPPKGKVRPKIRPTIAVGRTLVKDSASRETALLFVAYWSTLVGFRAYSQTAVRQAFHGCVGGLRLRVGLGARDLHRRKAALGQGL